MEFAKKQMKHRQGNCGQPLVSLKLHSVSRLAANAEKLNQLSPSTFGPVAIHIPKKKKNYQKLSITLWPAARYHINPHHIYNMQPHSARLWQTLESSIPGASSGSKLTDRASTELGFSGLQPLETVNQSHSHPKLLTAASININQLHTHHTTIQNIIISHWLQDYLLQDGCSRIFQSFQHPKGQGHGQLLGSKMNLQHVALHDSLGHGHADPSRAGLRQRRTVAKLPGGPQHVGCTWGLTKAASMCHINCTRWILNNIKQQ